MNRKQWKGYTKKIKNKKSSEKEGEHEIVTGSKSEHKTQQKQGAR